MPQTNIASALSVNRTTICFLYDCMVNIPVKLVERPCKFIIAINSAIINLRGVSTSLTSRTTIYQRRQMFEINTEQAYAFSDIPDQDLDGVLKVTGKFWCKL